MITSTTTNIITIASQQASQLPEVDTGNIAAAEARNTDKSAGLQIPQNPINRYVSSTNAALCDFLP